MDLPFQVPLQYCSLQHQTLLLSPVKSTTGYCFCFASIPSFFLELFLHWSPVAYWAPTDLGSSSFSIYLFAFSYCSWDSQGKNTEVVCYSLLQWTKFCQTSPPWPTILYTTFCLLIYSLMDTWVVSTFWLLLIMLLYKHGCADICSSSCFTIFGYIPRGIIAGSHDNAICLFFFFLRKTIFHSGCTLLHS